MAELHHINHILRDQMNEETLRMSGSKPIIESISCVYSDDDLLYYVVIKELSNNAMNSEGTRVCATYTFKPDGTIEYFDGFT
jgi:hypothetical protein